MEEVLRGGGDLPRTQFNTYSMPSRNQTSGAPQERNTGFSGVHPRSGFLVLLAGVDGYVNGSGKGFFSASKYPLDRAEFFLSFDKVLTLIGFEGFNGFIRAVIELSALQLMPSDLAGFNWVFGLSAISGEPGSILKSFKFDGRVVTEMITNVVNRSKNERHIIKIPKAMFFFSIVQIRRYVDEKSDQYVFKET